MDVFNCFSIMLYRIFDIGLLDTIQIQWTICIIYMALVVMTTEKTMGCGGDDNDDDDGCCGSI